MQITEQLIERIARRVFNSMFAPALRQSNVQGGGTSGSVRYADEAGHAASADEVAWTGVSGKPSFATVATSGSYNDLSNKPSIPTPSNLHSGYAANADYAVTAGSASSAAYATNANYATSAGNADTVDGYHESAFLHLSGGTMTGNIYIGNTTIYASGSNGGINSLAVADDCILGDCNIGGHLGLKSLNTTQAGISFYSNSGVQQGQITAYNGNVGIGTTSPSYKLHVAGVIYSSTGVYSEGYVTALSDVRKKDIQGDINLSVEDVASAPAIKFLWKQNRDAGMQAGTIAQYWQSVLPEAVQDHDGELSMSYGVTALMASIATAKKVVDHERRISELERENELLKEQLKQLKAA